MISICSVDIDSIAVRFGSRPLGVKARNALLHLLESNSVLEIDFHNRSIAPSFADECLGQLAARLGLPDFKRRIRLLNVCESTKPLVRHVVLRRCSEAAAEAVAQQ